MGVKIWINRNKIYLSIYAYGKLWRESTGLTVTEDKQQNKEVMRLAELLRSKKELAIISNQNGVMDPSSGRVFLVDYLAEIAEGKNKKYPIHKAIVWVQKLAPTIRLEDVTPKWFEDFQDRIVKESGFTLQTCENYCCAIRAAFKKAVRDGKMPKDPGLEVKHIRVPEAPIVYLTLEEIKRLIETPISIKQSKLAPEIRQAFLFALCTGLRVSDIQTLTWGMIDIPMKQIIKQQKKTKAPVYIPLQPEAFELINDKTLHKADELVFPIVAKTGTNTNQYLIAWGRRAKIDKNIGWHLARYTDATHLFENGADIYTVQHLLGHTKIETTARYAKITDKKRREAVSMLPEYGVAKTK
jgi:site-specific recombinase XerD